MLFHYFTVNLFYCCPVGFLKVDEVPCPPEHVVHFRRVLEIVIAELGLSVRVQETTKGSCVALKVVNLPANTLPETPSQGRSQLPFSQGMLEVKIVLELLLVLYLLVKFVFC